MILSRSKLYSQQRLDLEDMLAIMSAVRTDNKLWTKEFLSGQNYILKGFQVSGTGLTFAEVSMTDATFIIGGGTSDYSYFIAPPGGPNITVPASAFTDSARNYLELDLSTVDQTPITKAFWDPAANSGLGAEFNQTVNTITSLEVTVNVLTGGFSGSPDTLPLAIVDCDVAGVIKVILDQRDLFYRLSTPANPDNTYTWSSQIDPTYDLELTGVSGTFVAGDTLTFSSGPTATVTTGGTSSIHFNLPSDINFGNGNTVTASPSGATGTVNTITQNFSGADKDIANNKENDDAIKTEIAKIKGTPQWYNVATGSIAGVSQELNSAIVPITTKARYFWNGSSLSITDSNVSPSSSDVIAKIRLFSKSEQIGMARQDGTGGSTVIPIADGQVMFVSLPTSGNRTFSGTGSGSTNYQVVPYANFVVSDTNFWLAYREGTKLILRNQSELSTGESSDIGDDIPETLLNNIGFVDEVTPAIYTSTQIVVQGSSLVAAISALDNILGAPCYSEYWTVVSGSPGAGQINPVSSGSDVILPLNSRLGGHPQQYYLVGAGNLEVRLNGLVLDLGIDWNEVGSPASLSSYIEILTDNGIVVGDVLEFRLLIGGAVAAGPGSGDTLQDAYNAGNSITTAPSAPFHVISGGGKAAQFDGDIGVTGVIDPAGMELEEQSSNPLASGKAGIWVNSSGQLMSEDGTNPSLNITQEINDFISSGVTDVNGVTGSVTIQAGTGISIGVSGQFITITATGGGGSPGGPTNSLQYNDSGTLNGNSGFLVDIPNNALNLSGLNQTGLSSGITIANNTSSPTSLFTYLASYNFAIIEYSIVRNSIYSVGRLMITNDGTTTSLTDDFNTNVGVVFSAVISGSNVQINYTSTNTGFSGTFKYSMRRWS